MKDYNHSADIKKTADLLIKKAKMRRTRQGRSLFMNAAILGTYGWNICIPVFIGVFIGRFLDKHFPLPPLSWTLNFILIGFIVGFYNATRWLNKEGYKKNIKARLNEQKKWDKEN
ncbi:MAG: AtpZ/AtpI family protein [Alphaproteobacteria bacterium]